MRGLSEALRAFSPDVVHCHSVLSFTAFQVARIQGRLGYRLVLDNHMADFNVYPEGERLWKTFGKRAFYRALASTLGATILRHADAIVAIGEPERAFVGLLYGRACPDVPIIRLGADSRLFTFRPDARARIRGERGWQDGELVLGHAGTIRPSKRIDMLLEATSLLHDQRLGVKLFVVGKVDLAEKQQLAAIIRRLGLEDRVAFEEFVPVDRLPEYLSAMDIAVWPGDISNTAIEAMAVGLPVVAARTPYTEAVIERYGAGALFERASLDALMRALTALVRDSALRERQAASARAAVERDLNWRSIAAQFVQLYLAVVERRASTCRKKA
jgi:glycosyltransferase involved in cell wall biosynthesis